MKGRNTFSRNEIVTIKKLINQKVSSPRNTQKLYRDELRAMNFYISDFDINYPMTNEKLEMLIKRGDIKVVK